MSRNGLHLIRITGVLALLMASPLLAQNIPPAPDVQGVGSRYLKITPQPWDLDVALQVVGFPCVPPGFGLPASCEVCQGTNCVQGYVQDDGTLGPSPVFKSIEAWGEVFVHGVEIVPDAGYTARSEDAVNGLGPALTVAKTYRWGDTNGDCVVDQATDVQCIIDAANSQFTAACTPQSADLLGGPNSTPDGQTRPSEILTVIDALNGLPFPGPPTCIALDTVTPLVQRVHDVITLEGAGFGNFRPGTSRVIFTGTGGVSATVESPYVWRDDFIQLRVPTSLPTTGVLQISVDQTDGTGASNPHRFNVRGAAGDPSFRELTRIVADRDISDVLGAPNLNLTRTKDGDVGDIDGDGLPDLLDANSHNVTNDTTSVVRRNAGDLSFTATPLDSFPQDNAVTYDSDFVDLDNDGLSDIVQALSTFNGPLVRVLHNNGGTFEDVTASWVPTLLPPAGARADDVEHADLDGNGYVDIGLAYRFTGAADILFNQDGTNFGSSAEPVVSGAGSVHDLVFLDADRDGRQDVLLVSGDPELFLNDGASPPSFVPAGLLPSAGAAYLSGVSADINEDGWGDLVLAGSSVDLYLNDGTGAFPTKSALGGVVAGTLYDVEAGDLDLDGSVDLLVASIIRDAEEAISIWLNDGSGVFTEWTQPGALARFPSLEAYERLSADLLDLDLDGDLDVYFTGADGQSVVVGGIGMVANQLWENRLIQGSCLFDATFDNGRERFVFYGDPEDTLYSAGTASGGLLGTVLGNVDHDDIVNIEGTWERECTVASATTVTITVVAQLTLSSEYEANERGELRLSINGESRVLASISGNGNGGVPDTTGMVTYTESAVLPAGQNTIALECFNSQKTFSNEQTDCLFDRLTIE